MSKTIRFSISQETYNALQKLKELSGESWKEFFLLAIIRKLQDPRLYTGRGFRDDVSEEKAQKLITILQREIRGG